MHVFKCASRLLPSVCDILPNWCSRCPLIVWGYKLLVLFFTYLKTCILWLSRQVMNQHSWVRELKLVQNIVVHSVKLKWQMWRNVSNARWEYSYNYCVLVSNWVFSSSCTLNACLKWSLVGCAISLLCSCSLYMFCYLLYMYSMYSSDRGVHLNLLLMNLVTE